MNSAVSELREIGAAQIPGNPGSFYPDAYVRSGMPGIKGVGDKLTDAFARFSITASSPATVRFYVSQEAEAGVMPAELAKRKDDSVGWWTLYQLLAWPSREVFDALPSGAQLGCLTELWADDRAVRVQVDWENGHNIGFRPMATGWMWDAGTIFAVSERF